MPNQNEQVEMDAAGSYTTYLEYNKVLRTWFVAFGVGGPALFLVNENLASRLVAVGSLRLVAVLFLVGVGAQVLGALINKVANWYVHAAYTGSGVRSSSKYRFAEWVVNQFWFDIVVDAVTIGVFGYASWIVLTVFTA